MNFASHYVSLEKPVIMGVLNMTPDSFSDGGRYNTNLDTAQAQAERMVSHGASIIDVGGESTRPGALPVGTQEEMDRVLPIVEKLVQDKGYVVSVDTSSPTLMKEAASLGAGMLNDVRAFSREGCDEVLISILKETPDIALSVMHMRGQPINMQDQPEYQNVVDEVSEFLIDKVAELSALGFEKSQIAVDPGFGFGKSVEHNYQLLSGLQAFDGIAGPILVGMSRKSMIGAVTERDVSERLVGSCTAAGISVMRGAKIIRTHDVAETKDALAVAQAVCEFGI